MHVKGDFQILGRFLREWLSTYLCMIHRWIDLDETCSLVYNMTTFEASDQPKIVKPRKSLKNEKSSFLGYPWTDHLDFSSEGRGSRALPKTLKKFPEYFSPATLELNPRKVKNPWKSGNFGEFRGILGLLAKAAWDLSNKPTFANIASETKKQELKNWFAILSDRPPSTCPDSLPRLEKISKKFF